MTKIRAVCPKGHSWEAEQELRDDAPARRRDLLEFGIKRWTRIVKPAKCPTCGQKWKEAHSK